MRLLDSNLGATLTRRTLTVGGLAAAVVIVVVASPLWVSMSLARDVFARDARLPRLRSATLLAWLIACEVLGVLGAARVWLRHGLGRGAGHHAANVALQRWWTDLVFAGACRLLRLRVEVEGADRAVPGPVIVFVRHTSFADALIAAATVTNRHRLELRYVLKRELRWGPCLDIVGGRLHNVFVSRSAASRGDDIAAIARLAAGIDSTSGVILYPEGTRFTPAKRAARLDTMRREGSPFAARAAALQHVLPPRLGGPLALVDARPDSDVVFIEHVGMDGAASLANVLAGGLVGHTLRVRVRRFEAPSIPAGDRAGWLYERWAELDAWVGEAGSG